MKKQSAIGLFFSMFLRAAVIIMGIAIVIFGAVFLKKFMDKEKDKTPATTVGENVLTESEVHDDLLYNTATQEPGSQEVVTEQVVSEAAFDKNILVLNSTDVTGLAGRWCQRLNSYGYGNTSASDYATLQETTKIVAVTEGVGKELLQYFNGATYEVGTVTSGISVSTEGVDIIIIIGSADNDQ